jgi:type IV pilus assembly protein PilM
VENAAQAVVPYPLSNAAFDYLELSQGDDSARIVLWVSSAPEQVDWLRQAVTLAGMTPALVDVEACALTNAFAYNYQPQPGDLSLLLHVGAREATIALARGDTLLYSRGALIAFHRGHFESPHLAVRLAREIDRHWDDLAERASPGIIDRIYISGGPARDPRLAMAIGEQTGLTAAVIDPFHRIHYTGSTEAGDIAASHSPAMTIAVGLALRSFDDL